MELDEISSKTLVMAYLRERGLRVGQYNPNAAWIRVKLSNVDVFVAAHKTTVLVAHAPIPAAADGVYDLYHPNSLPEIYDHVMQFEEARRNMQFEEAWRNRL